MLSFPQLERFLSDLLSAELIARELETVTNFLQGNILPKIDNPVQFVTEFLCKKRRHIFHTAQPLIAQVHIVFHTQILKLNHNPLSTAYTSSLWKSSVCKIFRVVLSIILLNDVKLPRPLSKVPDGVSRLMNSSWSLMFSISKWSPSTSISQPTTDFT